LLLITAVVAIGLGTAVALANILRLKDFPQLGELATGTFVTSPLWLPIVFLAFALGRRRLTVRIVVMLAIAEMIVSGLLVSVVKIVDWLEK